MKHFSRASISCCCCFAHRSRAAPNASRSKPSKTIEHLRRSRSMVIRRDTKPLAELKVEDNLVGGVAVRNSKYLNNLIEQNHRRVKQRYSPVLGFKRLVHPQVTLSRIERAQTIKKAQIDRSASGKKQWRTDMSSRGGGLRCHLFKSNCLIMRFASCPCASSSLCNGYD